MFQSPWSGQICLNDMAAKGAEHIYIVSIPLIGSNLFKFKNSLSSQERGNVSIPLIGSNLFKCGSSILDFEDMEMFQSPWSGQICLNLASCQVAMMIPKSFQSPWSGQICLNQWQWKSYFSLRITVSIPLIGSNLFKWGLNLELIGRFCVSIPLIGSNLFKWVQWRLHRRHSLYRFNPLDRVKFV